jgi:hypothetical protein
VGKPVFGFVTMHLQAPERLRSSSAHRSFAPPFRRPGGESQHRGVLRFPHLPETGFFAC